MMFRAILHSMLLNLFMSVLSEYNYDCRRLDDCKNIANCIATTGQCSCVGSYGNYDCGIDTNYSTCSVDCQNGGTCYVVDSVDTCTCPYGFYGDNCEHAKFQIDCAGNIIKYFILLPLEFDGEVRLMNGDADVDESCVVTETKKTSYKEYLIAIDISSGQNLTEAPCKANNVQGIVNEETGESLCRGTLIITYIEGITTILDEIYYGNCTHETKPVILEDIAYTANKTVIVKNLTASEFSEVYRPVNLVVLDEFDALMTSESPIYIGTIFKLVVYLTNTEAYTMIRFERCETNNTLEDEEHCKFLVFDEGCSTHKSKHLTTGQTLRTYTPDSTALPAAELSIEAFKFLNSDQIGITCEAKICKAGDFSCNISTDCDTVRSESLETTTVTVVTTAVRRKRAASNNHAGDRETVSAIITIHEPDTVNDKGRNNTDMETVPADDCFTRTEVTMAVITLAVVLCILICVSLVLSCQIIKQKSKVESMTTPLSDLYRIPRAHMRIKNTRTHRYA